jgi:hypothetical protein
LIIDSFTSKTTWMAFFTGIIWGVQKIILWRAILVASIIYKIKGRFTFKAFWDSAAIARCTVLNTVKTCVRFWEIVRRSALGTLRVIAVVLIEEIWWGYDLAELTVIRIGATQTIWLAIIASEIFYIVIISLRAYSIAWGI